MRSPDSSTEPDRRGPPPRRPPRRQSHAGLVAAGVVIVVAGFSVGLVETLHFPRGSIWAIVAVTAALVGLIRAVTRSR
jgi:hypothetical protein